MDLRLGGLFLAALFLSGSALTPEECQPLVSPRSLVDPSVMYGRWNLIAGYVNCEAFNDFIKQTESSWVKIGPSSNPGEVEMSQENRINGTCLASSSNVTIHGNTASTTFANTSSDFHLLPGCDGCLILNINSTARDLDKVAHQMNVKLSVTAKEITAHTLYLFGNGTTLKDSDLERFRQQAGCLGFTGELDFHYDPKNGFCAEGEGIKITG